MGNLLSIIIPCYNEQDTIIPLYNAVRAIIDDMSHKHNIVFEILIIDDGSKDNSIEYIKRLCNEDKRVGYISFSRNFGKEAALYAGLKSSRGDYTAILDADLQDPPELLDEMYSIINRDEADCVAARRISRNGEPPLRSFFSRIFYRGLRKLTKLEVVDGARDFRLMKRKMVDSIISLAERSRFSKCLFAWVGYRTHWLEYTNKIRKNGKSRWSFLKLVLYAIDGVIAFSSIPLTFVSVSGLLFCLLSMIMVFIIVMRRLIWGDPVDGWASIVCIVIFMGGIQCFCTGILGTYISKIYNETKNRPHFIINEVLIPELK